jgi:hypothetical protein
MAMLGLLLTQQYTRDITTNQSIQKENTFNPSSVGTKINQQFATSIESQASMHVCSLTRLYTVG